MPKKFTYLNIDNLIANASRKNNDTWETCLHFKGHVAWVTTVRVEEISSPYLIYRSHSEYRTCLYFHQNFPSINNWWNKDGKPICLSNACLDKIFHVIQVYYDQGSLSANNISFTFREKIGDLYA